MLNACSVPQHRHNREWMGRRFVDYIFRVAELEFTYGVCGLLNLGRMSPASKF